MYIPLKPHLGVNFNTVKMSKIYKIYWVDKITGQKGQSQKPMTLKIANAWKNAMDKKYPYIKHKVI